MKNAHNEVGEGVSDAVSRLEEAAALVKQA
jgi:hypothetical protein